ncbi:MAG: hypothetical protein J2P25_12320, partial [Nocardiopsaceae bacterium]|nr:hypothetical protein [Nocardiopsaceae bacterium]
MASLTDGDTARCRELLAESLSLATDWYEHPPLAATLDAIAAYALRTDPEVAARLLGAAHTIRGAFDESSLHAPAVRTAARATLGTTAFDSAYASGRSLSREAALDLAAGICEGDYAPSAGLQQPRSTSRDGKWLI